MTREELLESHIYCPEAIDDRIEAYLKLGFDVLLESPKFFDTGKEDFAILFRVTQKGCDMIPSFTLRICNNFVDLQKLFEYPKHRLFRQDYMPVPVYCIQYDDIDILIRKLKYENIEKTEETVYKIF